jgi:hypothetical protein
MIQTLTLCVTLVAVATQVSVAQTATVVIPSLAPLQQIALVEPLPAAPPLTEPLPNAPISSSLEAELPDAPEPVATSKAANEDPQGQPFAGPVEPSVGPSAGMAPPRLAPRYSPIILPNETSQPLHGSQWLIFGLRDSFNIYQFGSIALSAGWSQLIDSRPHYGQDGDAYGKRVGVGALRSTIQAVATDSVFSPIFHEDPRYYVMGKESGKGYVKRALYAATRVFVTRTNSGGTSINGALLAGYGVAAGMNNIYYPDQDRGAKNTATEWASSLGGAALGFEAEEFLKDALNIFHRITKTDQKTD